jgi:hypothetical protein
MPVGEYVSDYLGIVTTYVQEILREFSGGAWPATNRFLNLTELDPATVENETTQRVKSSQGKIRAIRI